MKSLLHVAARTQPDGIGGLISLPLTNSSAILTSVPADRYLLWADLGWTDAGDKVANLFAQVLNMLCLLLTQLAIALSWWLERVTHTDGLGTELGDSLDRVSSELGGWLLPTCLAIGAGLTYGMARTGRGVFGQLATVVAAGVLAVGMMTSSGPITGTLDDVRQLVATGVATMGADAVTIDTEVPFKWDADLESADPDVELSLKSGEAIWRTFAVTPWCEMNFGSLEACRAYGADWLRLPDEKARENFVNGRIQDAEGGEDSPTVQYMKGHDPSQRLVVGVLWLCSSIGVLVLIGGLALTALVAWLTALLLLALGVVWACMLIIPGWSRRIGATMFETIAGLTLVSALMSGLLAGTLLVTTAAMKLVGGQGWLPMALVGLGTLGAAWKAKGILERTLAGAGGIGGNMLTALAAGRAMQKLRPRMSHGGKGRAGALQRLRELRARGGGEGGTQRTPGASPDVSPSGSGAVIFTPRGRRGVDRRSTHGTDDSRPARERGHDDQRPAGRPAANAPARRPGDAGRARQDSPRPGRQQPTRSTQQRPSEPVSRPSRMGSRYEMPTPKPAPTPRRRPPAPRREVQPRPTGRPRLSQERNSGTDRAS